MRAELRDSLAFIYADDAVAQTPLAKATLDVARGGTAAVQVLVDGLEAGGELRFDVSLDGRPVDAARWYRLRHVPVERNTGPVGFVEKEGEVNESAARRAPFRVYDAMEPVDGVVTSCAASEALLLHIPVDRDAAGGARGYSIAVVAGAESRSLALDVEVHAPVLPPVGRDTLPYTNWFSTDHMARRHGLEPWSEEHWRMIAAYAGLMARGRQNMFWVPLRNVFELVDGEPRLDRDRLRRLVETFTAAGLHFIEGGHVAGRTGGEWKATTFDTVLTKKRATSLEGNATLAAIGRQLMEEIDRNGWRERWLQHVTDEPAKENATEYRLLAGMVRRHMPGLPLVDASMCEQITGSLDIWCPQAQEYQAHRAFFESQRRLGDRVWFYTCCFPGGPWLNRLLDMELVRPALFGWAASLYDLQGFLHWGLNNYKSDQDPFERSVVDHGGNNQLPGGDTHVVYPGDGAPWSSVRFEAQREGFEDFELLRVLKARDAAAARDVIAPVIRSFDDYTKDAAQIRAARGALLRALAG